MDTRRRAFSNPKYTDAFSPAFVYAMLGVVNFMKQAFTREEVIKILDELLQRPHILIDAVENEDTDYDAESLLEFVEELGV